MCRAFSWKQAPGLFPVSNVTGRQESQLSEGPSSPTPSTYRGRGPFGLRPRQLPETMAGHQPSRGREAKF